MYGVIILIMLILQWNARSLLANGQDFKNFVNNRSEKPDIVCVQESGIKSSFSLVWEHRDGWWLHDICEGRSSKCSGW